MVITVDERDSGGAVMVVRTHFDSQTAWRRSSWDLKKACALSSPKPKQSSPACLHKEADTVALDGRCGVSNPQPALVEPTRKARDCCPNSSAEAQLDQSSSPRPPDQQRTIGRG